jgi:RNA polymerase sporulation-specific sigma factor
LLRYFRDLSQANTAAALGLTQVKISREEKKLLAFLREQLS